MHEIIPVWLIRELGSVVRSLGKCPTEAELSSLISDCEEEESSGVIKFSFFLPVMEGILKDKNYEPDSIQVIKAAFEVKYGYLNICE